MKLNIDTQNDAIFERKCKFQPIMFRIYTLKCWGIYSNICKRSSNFCPAKNLPTSQESWENDLPMCQVGLLGEASLQAGEASDQVPPFAPRASLKSPEIQSTPISIFCTSFCTACL